MNPAAHKHYNEKDYYPFGMLMPGRSYTAGSQYRFGFNGKENDNEVKGVGNSVDFGARIYDPRIGRWLSVDPLTSKYPNLTPYNFADENPVRNIDPDGRSIEPVNKDAEILLKATFESFGGKKFYAALKISNKNGIIRSNLFNKDATTMNINEFKKALKQKDIKLRKDDLKAAYNFYATLESSSKIELAVFSKSTTSTTFDPGEKGTILVDEEGKSTNENFKVFTEKFGKNSATLDQVTDGKKYGVLEYKPQKSNDPDPTHSGTLIIDATEEKPEQTIKTLNEAFETKVTLMRQLGFSFNLILFLTLLSWDLNAQANKICGDTNLVSINTIEIGEITLYVSDFKINLANGKWYYYNAKNCNKKNIDKFLLLEGEFLDFKRHGIFKYYYEAGKNTRYEIRPYIIVNYKNGQLDGIFKVFYSNGTMLYEGCFVNGLKSGFFIEYDPAKLNNTIKQIDLFLDDTLRYTTMYNTMN